MVLCISWGKINKYNAHNTKKRTGTNTCRYKKSFPHGCRGSLGWMVLWRKRGQISRTYILKIQPHKTKWKQLQEKFASWWPRFVRVNGVVVKARTNYQIQSNSIKHTQIRPNTNEHKKISSWLPGFVRKNGVVVKARTNNQIQSNTSNTN